MTREDSLFLAAALGRIDPRLPRLFLAARGDAVARAQLRDLVTDGGGLRAEELLARLEAALDEPTT